MIVSLSSSVLQDLENTFVQGLAVSAGCRWEGVCRQVLTQGPDWELGTYCRNCHPFIPALVAVRHMKCYLDRWGDPVYDLAIDHPWYKLLKDKLPEHISSSEADSFFYTFVPEERLPLDPETLNKMAAFCGEVFENTDYIRESWWVVESGKHPERPNPHIHAVIRFNGKPKNWQRDQVRKKWKSFFPDPAHRLDWMRKVGKKMFKGTDKYTCTTNRITLDKIDYLDNDRKNSMLGGTDHTNFVDLGINGGLNKGVL